MSESQDRPHPQPVVELDRRAWSLPSALVTPAGPVREVWPVRQVPSRDLGIPSRDLGGGFFEDFFDDEAA